MTKATRQVLAVLFLCILLVILGMISLFHLTFESINVFVGILELVDGILWGSTLLP